MDDHLTAELKAIRKEVMGDAEYDNGSQAEKRAEQEWMNPDLLLRGRLLVLRNEADVLAERIRALLREFPSAASTDRACTYVRFMESNFAQCREYLGYIRDEFRGS